MNAPPDDLFRMDDTIPTEDPAIAASQAKQRAAFEKEQKALAAQEKKMQAEEAKKVKKDMERPGHKEKAAAEVSARTRENKAHKIRLYYEKLGHKLSTKAPKTLPTDDAKLDELLASIECELHSNGGIEQAGVAFISGMAAVEQLTAVFNPLGLQLSGPAASLSSTVAQNKAKWDELITEFAISNAEYFMIGPGKRLLMFSVQMVMAVDSANKAAAGRSAPASEAAMKAAADLMGKGKEQA